MGVRGRGPDGRLRRVRWARCQERAADHGKQVARAPWATEGSKVPLPVGANPTRPYGSAPNEHPDSTRCCASGPTGYRLKSHRGPSLHRPSRSSRRPKRVRAGGLGLRLCAGAGAVYAPSGDDTASRTRLGESPPRAIPVEAAARRGALGQRPHGACHLRAGRKHERHPDVMSRDERRRVHDSSALARSEPVPDPDPRRCRLDGR